MANEYLDNKVKSDLKTKFLSQYKDLLSYTGKTDPQITKIFEDFYSSCKTTISNKIGSFNRSMISSGNKGFANNKGWFSINVTNLTTQFVMEFNKKINSLDKDISKAAASKLAKKSVDTTKSDASKKMTQNEAVQLFKNGSITGEDFAEILRGLGAYSIKTNSYSNNQTLTGHKQYVTNVSYIINGTNYSTTQTTFNYPLVKQESKHWNSVPLNKNNKLDVKALIAQGARCGTNIFLKHSPLRGCT